LLLENGANPNVKGKYLIHKAADAHYQSIVKVKYLLMRSDCDVNQVDQTGQTLLHRAAGGKPPRPELMKLVLEQECVDPNKQDRKGDTALHKAAGNYAGKEREWKQCTDVMRLLLHHKHINPNIRNKKGQTPLQNLLTAKSALPQSVVLEWLKAGADFTREVIEVGESSTKSPLGMLATRKDGPQLLTALADPLKAVISSNLQIMLKGAVTNGTAEMVQCLLNKGASANEGEGLLILLAASSPVEAASKIKLLHDSQAKRYYKDGKDFTALHVAAASDSTSDDVLKACVETLGLKLSDTDKSLNTPLHIAAINRNPGSPTLVRFLSKKKLGGNPNCRNTLNQTPLQLVLKGPKELRHNKLAFLLENGCQPDEQDLQSFEGDAEEFESLFVSTEILVKSQRPMRLLMALGKYCRDRHRKEKQEQTKDRNQTLEETWQKAKWRRSKKWLELNEKLEQEAILMIEEFGKDEVVLQGVMTNDDIDAADDLKWHKLLANENVGSLLMQMFNGRVDAGDAEAGEYWWQQFGRGKHREKWYHFIDLILLTILQSFLLPLYLVTFPLFCCFLSCRCQCVKARFVNFFSVDPRQLPVVTFGSSLVGYLFFLAFLAARIATGSKNNEDIFSWLDWVILVYILAMVAEELYQIITRRREYLGVTNILDDLVTILFCVFYVTRGIGFVADSLPILRASEHIFAISASLAFVRVLYYMQVHRRLGPIQISFREITTEVVSFLIILAVFLLSFSIALSGVYNARIYTELYRNQSDTSGHTSQGLGPFLQTMYWSLYGLIEYSDIKGTYEDFQPETTIGLLLFGVWSLVSVIVLLNMLIAVISEAFDRVKNDNADLVWHLAISRIIREIQHSPSCPLPFNLFFLLGLLGSSIYDNVICRNGKCCCVCKVFHKGDGKDEAKGEKIEDRGITVTAAITATRMTAAYQKAKQEREFDKIQSEMQQTLKTFSEQLNHQIASQLEGMNTRMKRHLKSHRNLVNKHLKRVPSSMRHLNKMASANERFAAQDNVEGDQLQITDDSDDSDTEDDLQATGIRHERVHLDGNVISYAGKGREVAVCQFLCSPLSNAFEYFEVVITDCGEHSAMRVGLARRNYPLNQMPGLQVGSVAFPSDELFNENVYGQELLSPVHQGDVIGCGIDSSTYGDDKGDKTVTIFFTRNGDEVDRTNVTCPRGGLFPTIGLHSEGETVIVNLDAKWPPSEEKDTVLPTKALRLTPNRLHFNDEEGILRYQSTLQEGAGIFQDLNHPFSKESNYFELIVVDLGIRSGISIGVASRSCPLDTILGQSTDSVAYHCDDGVVYNGHTGGRSMYTPIDVRESIGCGIEFNRKTKQAKVFFTLNSELFHESSIHIPSGGLFPTVGMFSPGEQVKFNEEAKWPPKSKAATLISPIMSHYERVHVNSEFIEYAGDWQKNVGGFQSLSRPMDREFSYYEATVVDYGSRGAIAVGLAKRYYPLHRQPGWDEGSIAWHCNDGRLLPVEDKEELSFEPAEEGDVIGCGIDFKDCRRTGNDVAFVVVFFTRNGEKFAQKEVSVPEGGFFPTIGMHSDGEKVKINLSVVWKQLAYHSTDRTLGTETVSAMVCVEGDRVAYGDCEDNRVGGVQLLSRPISELSGYYEVKLLSTGEHGTTCIGLARRGYPLDCQPGWVTGSIAYHCNDGTLYYDGNAKKGFFQASNTGDVIGCGVQKKINKDDHVQQFVFFTHNGKEIGKEIFDYPPANELYPIIGMHSRGEVVKVNPDATWDEIQRKAKLFSRAERVQINGNRVNYELDMYRKVGGVQVGRQMSEDFPYFEVKILNLGAKGAVGIGLAREDYPLDCEPGWLHGSVGFLSDDGKLFTGDGIGRAFSHSSVQGDVVGCGIDFKQSEITNNTVTVFYTRNWSKIGQTKIVMPHGGLFPTVGMCSRDEAVEINVDARWPTKLHTKNTKSTYAFHNPIFHDSDFQMTMTVV
jgi:ankyrin repeat protein